MKVTVESGTPPFEARRLDIAVDRYRSLKIVEIDGEIMVIEHYDIEGQESADECVYSIVPAKDEL